jgi:hypothetical protein
VAETIGSSSWRQRVATVVVLAYGYQLVAWPLLFWAASLATGLTGYQVAAPPLLPWEHLAVGTGTLVSILGIDIARDKFVPPEQNKNAQRL